MGKSASWNENATTSKALPNNQHGIIEDGKPLWHDALFPLQNKIRRGA